MHALAVKHRLPGSLWAGLFRENPSGLGEGMECTPRQEQLLCPRHTAAILDWGVERSLFSLGCEADLSGQPFHKEELRLEMPGPRSLWVRQTGLAIKEKKKGKTLFYCPGSVFISWELWMDFASDQSLLYLHLASYSWGSLAGGEGGRGDTGEGGPWRVDGLASVTTSYGTEGLLITAGWRSWASLSSFWCTC